ncbi:O-antigen ligase family protein [Vibrio sp. PNB22_8_1]
MNNNVNTYNGKPALVLAISFSLLFFKTSLLYPIKVLTFPSNIYYVILPIYNFLVIFIGLLAFRRVNAVSFIFFLLLILYVLGSIVYFDTSPDSLEILSVFIKSVLVPFVVFIFIREYDLLYRVMLNLSRSVSMMLCILAPISLLPNTNYMEYGFSLSLTLVIVASNVAYNKCFVKLDIVILLLGLFVLFLFGNRGAFIAVALLTFFLYFLSPKFKLISKIKTLVITIISLIVLLFSLLPILKFVHFWLIDLGYRSYATQKYINYLTGSGDLSSGRTSIYDYGLSLVNDNNFFPNGLNYFHSMSGELYTHNFIIDIFISHGFFAFILISVLILGLIFVLRVSYVTHLTLIFVPFFIYTILKLSLSSYVWYELPFWMSVCLLFVYIYRCENNLD